MEPGKEVQNDKKCPVCDKGTLEPRIMTAQEREDKGEPPADLHFSVCDFCESDITDGPQMFINKLNMIKYLAGKGDLSKAIKLFGEFNVWTHSRGQAYKIVGLSNLSTTKPGWAPTVTYHPVEDEGNWYSRPIVDFLGSCTPCKEDVSIGQC